jgi:hypothetical protein
MAGITLTNGQFNTFASVVSYMVYNKCQSLNDKTLQPHMSHFCLDCNSSIDDWRVSLLLSVRYRTNGNGERTITDACVDYMSATFDGKVIKLTDRQIDELNEVINYTATEGLP